MLIILSNNSFGFSMTIPKDGIDLYGGKARLFDTINMSNRGLDRKRHTEASYLNNEFKGVQILS